MVAPRLHSLFRWLVAMWCSAMYIKRFAFALPTAHYSTTNANMPDALVPGYVKSWAPSRTISGRIEFG